MNAQQHQQLLNLVKNQNNTNNIINQQSSAPSSPYINGLPHNNNEDNWVQRAKQFNDYNYNRTPIRKRYSQSSVDYSQSHSQSQSSVESLISKMQNELYNSKFEILSGKPTINIPLHKFSYDDVAETIAKWVFNDIDYKMCLSQIGKDLAKQMDVSLQQQEDLSDNIKFVLQQNMSTFMTSKTVNIVLQNYERWKKIDREQITERGREAIGNFAFHYPLVELIEQIKEKEINGIQFVQLYLQNQCFIKESTGWTEEHIDQIKFIFAKQQTFSIEQLNEHMNYVINEHKKTSTPLPDTIIEQIRIAILDFADIDEMHYKIKNAQNIQAFSVYIIDTVDEIIDNNKQNKIHDKNAAYLGTDFVHQLYELIANFFIVKDHNLFKNTDIFSLGRKEWTCCNCGNRKHAKYVNGSLDTDMSFCDLCGIKQIDSIKLQLRNYDTFLMVKNIDTESDDDKDDDAKDDIDLLIKNATQTQRLSLYCSDQNDKHNCASMRLAK
eukprot:498352_1